MTLRKKILLLISMVTLSVIALLYVVSSTIIVRRFVNLEGKYTVSSVNGALRVLEEDLFHMKTIVTDWAMWDDTYAFIENHNQSYIEANFDDDTFVYLKLNFIALADSSGNIAFEKAVDLDSGEQIPLSIQGYLTPDSPLLVHTSLDSTVSGILCLPDNPMLVTSHPILNSKGEGPVRGTLIMGRYLDEAAISSLEGRIQQHIILEPASVMELPAGFWEKVEASKIENPVIVQPLDGKTVAGYTPVRDIYNSPRLILKLEIARDIYHEGLNSAILLSLAVVALLACAMIPVLLIFDRQVLLRLANITSFVRNIGKQGDLSSRITVTGRDELSTLSSSINVMLDVLGKAQSRLRQSEEEYRSLLEQSQQQYDDEKRLRKALEEESSKRVEFTRALVHELKTPITPVLAAVELLKEEVRDERLMRLVQSIDRSASNLNQRIDELLDLARGEIDMLRLNIESVEMLPLLQEIAYEMAPVAVQGGQTLVCDLPPCLPIISADRTRLRQVVVNLLNNALKFTPAGGTITLSVRVEGNNLIVQVQYTGRGISQEDQVRLFEPYHRRIGDRDRLSGLGLGLILSKKFIELHKGEIWARSQKGEGSTFGFSLPLETYDYEDKHASIPPY